MMLFTKTKNLADLNQYPWYRLAKIIYIVALIVAIVIALLGSAGFAFYKQHEETIDTWREQFATEDLVEQVRERYPEYAQLNRSAITQELMRNPAQFQSLLSEFQSGSINQAQVGQLGQLFVRARLSAPKRYFDIGKQLIEGAPELLQLDGTENRGKSRTFFWVRFVLYALPSVALVILLFESAKRLFYYVAVGSFFPKKTERKKGLKEKIKKPLE